MIDAYGWIAQLRTSRGVMRYPLPPVTLKRRGKSVNPELFACSEDDWRLLGIKPTRAA
jgi:hypothetical protein